MTPKELKAHRVTLGLNIAEMAARLQTRYRTYQSWENGTRRIPGICAAAVQMLLERDRLFMDRLKNGGVHAAVKDCEMVCQNAP